LRPAHQFEVALRSPEMIDLYFWITPNGYKVTILIEELEWKYNVIPIRIGKGD
jgi:GST-like protein